MRIGIDAILHVQTKTLTLTLILESLTKPLHKTRPHKTRHEDSTAQHKDRTRQDKTDKNKDKTTEHKHNTKIRQR